MSKMDGLRAMREARYERTEARRSAAPPREKLPVAPAETAAAPVKRAPARKAPAKASTSAPAADGELCGHRNMGGRTCTREAGHAAKSHRYA